MKKSNENNRKQRIMIVAVVAALIGIMAVFVSSCKVGVVRGSGDIASEEREVSAFNEVYFSGMGSLRIEQGQEESLTIEADDNLIDLIETEVRGNELQIKFRRGFSIIPTAEIKIFLTVKDLNMIDLSGVGDIESEGFNTDELEFNINGSGNIDFVVEADSLETNVSGLGDIILSGKVDSHRVQISGSGKYDARDLESRECEVEVSGLGSATVNVSEDLKIDISGAGSVYYLGDPSISQNISGLGRISSLD